MISSSLAQVGPPKGGILTPGVSWVGLLPLLVLAGAAVLLLSIASFTKGRLPPVFCPIYMLLASIGTIGAAVPLWIRVQDVNARGPFATLDSAYGIDGFSVFITILLATVVGLVGLLASDYLKRESLDGPEFYVLMMLSASGGIIMASANDLIVMFLGLEILSLAVYVLASIHARRIESQEAGMKYFLLGALSSAIFLYGIALTYGAIGTTNLVDIKEFLATTVVADDALLFAGLALLLVGFSFKVAAAPFHSWAPDVYQGSPTPVASFMASVVKTAAFAGLLRVLYVAFGDYRSDWQPIVYFLAITTLVVGSFLAIVQTDVKRMLAYSSVSHAGFLLIGVQAANPEGTASVLFYLTAYSFMAVGSFTVVTLVAGVGDERTGLGDLKGLSRTRPKLAIALTIFLLGQAGVPFTSGFFAKFYVIESAIEARSFPLAIVAMLVAVVAAFLYLRIMVSVWLDSDEDSSSNYVAELSNSNEGLEVSSGVAAVLIVTLGFTIIFGIWPQPVVEMARDAVPLLKRG